MENTNKLKKILENVVFADKFNFHNQIINFLDTFNVDENSPKILINFDLHSDLKINRSSYQNCVWNWVNLVFTKYGIEKYYWVVPTHILNDQEMVETIFINPPQRHTFFGNSSEKPYADFSKPLEQSFIIDLQKNKILMDTVNSKKLQNEKIQENPEKFKVITIFTCTENNMPDFSNEKIIVSVDGDYFSNNGFDTINQYAHTPENIQKSFDSFTQCLYEKNIKPTYMCLCLSDNYTQDLEHTNEFFDIICQNYQPKENYTVIYDYTDLRYKDYDENIVYFFHIDSCFDILYNENNRFTDSDIIKVLNKYKNSFETGIYKLEFYSIKETNNLKEDISKIYPYQYDLTKISEENAQIQILINKMKNKINYLQEQLNKIE